MFYGALRLSGHGSVKVLVDMSTRGYLMRQPRKIPSPACGQEPFGAEDLKKNPASTFGPRRVPVPAGFVEGRQCVYVSELIPVIWQIYQISLLFSAT
jgi:hypothetical protein